MKTSEQIDQIAAALIKAQAAIGVAIKDRVGKVQTKSGTSYEYRYSDLATVVDAVKPHLNANGIAIIQAASGDAAGVGVETMLLHSSGQWMSERLYMPIIGGAQAMGSGIAYCRRYGLQSFVVLPSEDDDDGVAASAKKPRRGPLPQPIPANIEGRNAWEKYDNATRDMLSGVIAKTIELHESQATGGDPAGYLRSQGFDDETKLAVWSQLPSHVRAAIKKADRASLASQP